MQNFDAKKYFNFWKKYFLAWHFIENQVFIIFTLFPCFSVFIIQINASSLSSDQVVIYLQCKTYVDRKSIYDLQVVFAFTKKRLEDVLKRLKEALRTLSVRCFDDILKKGRCSFHFKSIQDIFETKTKPVFRRLCDVFVSARKPKVAGSCPIASYVQKVNSLQ